MKTINLSAAHLECVAVVVVVVVVVFFFLHSSCLHFTCASSGHNFRVASLVCCCFFFSLLELRGVYGQQLILYLHLPCIRTGTHFNESTSSFFFFLLFFCLLLLLGRDRERDSIIYWKFQSETCFGDKIYQK